MVELAQKLSICCFFSKSADNNRRQWRRRSIGSMDTKLWWRKNTRISKRPFTTKDKSTNARMDIYEQKKFNSKKPAHKDNTLTIGFFDTPLQVYIQKQLTMR
ncbi:long isoform,Ulvan lyase [Trichinella spiralis]|uniref:Long isoform,Ulvan lyase n=1 Tax=Trichinella spiralis TaxID=6334 RepID=A0ABR3K6X6_TRISP